MRMIPFTFSNKTIQVVGVDLSKNSIGLARFELVHIANKIEFKYKDSFTLKENPAGIGRFALLTIERQFEKIHKILSDLKNNSCDVSIALEHNIFGPHAFYSEQQYHLTQTFLNICKSLNLNVVSYSPLMLKSFIKSFSNSKDLPKFLSKTDIKEIYREYYGYSKIQLPNIETIKSNDEVDAIFLSLLGLFSQSILSRRYDEVKPPYSIKEYSNLNYAMFNFNLDFYRQEFLNEGVLIPEHLKFRADAFKKLFLSLKRNKHLSTTSNMFFPFKIFSDLKTLIINHYEDPSSTNFMSYFSHFTKNPKIMKGIIKEGKFDLYLDVNGKISSYK